MSSLFGWDLIYASVQRDIKSNQDILVCFTHLVLVSNGFKCIGIGESKNFDGNEPQSEALPNGWNDDYALRYIYQGRLYNLKGTRLDDGVIINLIRVEERTVSMVQHNSRMIAKRNGTLKEMIPDCDNLSDVIKKQLIDKVAVSTRQTDNSCQTAPETSRNSGFGSQPISPLCEPPRNPMHPYIPGGIPGYGSGVGIGPGYGGGVGRSDLHPFGTGPNLFNPPGGGGMIFMPPGRGSGPPNLGIPPGSLPPGARFDPFRPPPDNDRFNPAPRRPDNDEFPPPGYDDMYM